MRGNPHVRFGPEAAGKGPAPCRHLAGVLPVPCWDADFGPVVHQVLHLLPVADQDVAQRPRVGQTPSRQGRHRVHRTVQRVRRLSTIPPRCRRSATGSDPGSIRRVLPTLAGSAAAAARPSRPRRRLLVGAVDARRSRCPAPWCSTQPRYARGLLRGAGHRQPRPRPPGHRSRSSSTGQIRGGQRATGGEFRTKVITRGTEVTVQRLLQALPDQAIPERRARAADRDRDQRTRRPGLPAPPAQSRRAASQGPCGQRPRVAG